MENLRTCTSRIMIPMLCAALAAPALGDGFRNPSEGAAAQGRAGMRVAYGDDATAVTHNPASLMDLEKAELTAGATIAFVEVDFTDALTGAGDTSEDPWRVLPYVYGAWPIRDGRTVIGLGLHLPYGQYSKWDANNVFKGRSAYYAKMTTLDFTPVLATRLTDRIYIGAGPDLIWSQLELEQIVPFSMMLGDPAAPDGTMLADGDGFALGAHAGLTWLISANQRFAVSYRAPFSVEYKGDFEIENGLPPALLPPPLTTASDFETEIEFPAVVVFGYGWQATETLRLEANVEWVEHSCNDVIVLDAGNNNLLLNPPTVPNPLAPAALPQDWDDVWTVGLGLDWRFAPEWILRAGWTYLPTPVPEANMAPTLPDSDRHLLALGLGYETGRHTVDLACVVTVADDATVVNPLNPVPGTYAFTSQVFGLSYACTF
jgi:long-chain fatty acid transport protein